MPIIRSAKKALRQSRRRREENRSRSDAMKTAIKSYRKLVDGGKLDEARTALAKVYQTLDKAAKKGTIKKNRASRLKSRLAALIAKK